MKKTGLFLIAFLVCMPLAADSDPLNRGGVYLGVGLGPIDFNGEIFSEDFQFISVIARAGYFLFDYVSVEARAAAALTDDTVFVKGIGELVQSREYEVDMKRLWGAYLVGHLPLGSMGGLYALLGFSDAKVSYESSGFSAADKETGFSYGVGAELYASSRVGFSLEYVQYLDEDEFDLSGITMSVKFHFR